MNDRQVLHAGTGEDNVQLYSTSFPLRSAPGAYLGAAVLVRLLGLILGALASAAAKPPRDIPAGPSFFRFSDDEEFVALLRDNGLTGVEVTDIAFTHRAEAADQLWGRAVDEHGPSLRPDHPPARIDQKRRMPAAFDDELVAFSQGRHA